MPELPEVQTVLDTLKTRIRDRKINDIDILYEPIIVNDPLFFKEKLAGQHFREFLRRGKYLLLELDDVTLVSHLRMEGKYFIVDESYPLSRHDHVIFYLDDGSQLRYNDVRKFGRMEIIDKRADYDDFKDLGPEPFSAAFNADYCLDYFKKHKKPVKEILLDQSFVAGIGNIYADEILFAIGIHPLSSAADLDGNDAEKLIEETRRILKEAIAAGGTTIRSYTSSLGVTGRFQQSLKAHGQEKCPQCGGDIAKIRVGGRGTYFCERCQVYK